MWETIVILTKLPGTDASQHRLHQQNRVDLDWYQACELREARDDSIVFTYGGRHEIQFATFRNSHRFVDCFNSLVRSSLLYGRVRPQQANNIDRDGEESRV